jgi:hypothetical protein
VALEAAGDTAVAAHHATPLVARLWRGRDVLIAAFALAGIVVHLTLRHGIGRRKTARTCCRRGRSEVIDLAAVLNALRMAAPISADFSD